MLEVNTISFTYKTERVINNINFSLLKGQNLAIIGQSGSGKSTLLKLIYGLYDLDEGEIFWNQIPILGPKFNLVPGAPFMKYLAQDFDLMPYITAEENVGKYLSNIQPEKKSARVNELLEMVEMMPFAKTKTKYLSGGQQQRLALARVLALEPEVLLLDEPFSNIDSFRKNALRRNLFAYLKQKEITCIIATHDSTDALSFSDETIVMKNGEIMQYGVSKALYLKPKNNYVASLFGEVNSIKVHYLLPVLETDKTILVYANELFLTNTSLLEVKVKSTYFRGNHYLVKAVFDNEILFFENDCDIEKEKMVCLAVDEALIKTRL